MSNLDRLNALPDDATPEDTLRDQLAIVMDTAVAQLIRNSRSGQGIGLREAGFTETADELGL